MTPHPRTFEDGTVRTERLLLRRFTPQDGDALHGYLARPEAVRFEPYGVQDRAQCHRLAAARAEDPAFWAICRQDDDRLLGNLYFRQEDPHEWATYSLGYVLDPAQWHQGYATEAATGLLDRAFRHGAARRVTARCNPLNTASWRLLERLGLRREGHLRQVASFSTHPDGRPRWHDAYLYAVLDEEWSTPTT